MVHHQKQILKNSSAHFAGIYSILKKTQLRGGHSACKGDYEAHARIIFSFNCRLAGNLGQTSRRHRMMSGSPPKSDVVAPRLRYAVKTYQHEGRILAVTKLRARG